MTPSGFSGLFKRIFGADSPEEFSIEEKGEVSAARRPDGAPSPGQDPSGQGRLAAARKVAMLRRALEFDEDLADKLGEVHTTRSMLLFMHQNVMLKFEHLHELGILGDASYATISVISAKNREVLAAPDQTEGQGDPAALAQENESLRRQLKSIYDKHVKSDIISGKEVALEEEKARLQARLDDLRQRYNGALKRIEGLQGENEALKQVEAKHKLLSAKVASAERGALEMEKNAKVLQELESQNRLLKGRVEHQERLIQAMSWGDPKHKELFESIEELGDQKRKLQRQLMDGDALGRVWESLPGEGEGHAGVGALLQENRSLYEKLQSTDATLDVVAQSGAGPELLSSMEGLREDTFRLGELARAKQSIETQLDEKNKRIRDVSAMMEHLRRENELLKQALEAKSRKAEAVAEDPVKRKLMEAVSTLRKENSRLQLEMENLHYVVSSISARNEAVEQKLRQLISAARENRWLKQEAERKETLLADCRKRDEELRGMKKFCYQLQSEFNRVKHEHAKALEEIQRLEAKIRKVRSEYEGMISEYNKLFEGD